MISGKIEAIVPAELLQVFHIASENRQAHYGIRGGLSPGDIQRRGAARGSFFFEDLDNQEAVYAILSEKKGQFHFIPGLPDAMMRTREIGDFMMILMEGLRRLDEDE